MSHTSHRSGFLALFGAALCCITASIAPEPEHWPWKTGQEFHGVFEITGHTVPLPVGSWTLVGVGVDPAKPTPRSSYGVIFSLVFFKHTASSVDAFLILHANAIPTGDGWGLSRDCLQKEIPFVKIDDNTDRHAFCTFVRPLVVAPHQTLGAWRDAVHFADTQGWHLPPSWLEAGFRISDPYDVLDVRYAFRPPPIPLPHSTSADPDNGRSLPAEVMAAFSGLWHTVDFWHAPSPSVPVPDKASLDALVHWTDETAPLVKRGFKRLLPSVTLRMPNDPPPAEQAAAPSPGHPPAEEMSNAKLGLLKTLSSRVTNISTSLGIDYLFVRDLYTVSGLQVVSSTLHGGVDYVEEWMWNTYGPQRLRQSGTVDFTYVEAQ